jgi:CRISPR/Cas system Type II protein with McrA/HNH and RuvC-like nuclease domain
MAVLNGKEVDIMAIVITNGEYYIQNTKNGKVKKTKDINEATQFYNVNKAMRKILGKPAQCKGYYLFDTEDTYVKKKNNRKHYSQDVRKLLYDNVKGKCAICGKQLLFSEITLDHIIPLNQNGEDEVENLQICCYQCNQMKGSILPVDLFQKVTEIFMYQTEKKTTHSLKWKIVHRLLQSCIK